MRFRYCLFFNCSPPQKYHVFHFQIHTTPNAIPVAIDILLLLNTFPSPSSQKIHVYTCMSFSFYLLPYPSLPYPPLPPLPLPPLPLPPLPYPSLPYPPLPLPPLPLPPLPSPTPPSPTLPSPTPYTAPNLEFESTAYTVSSADSTITVCLTYSATDAVYAPFDAEVALTKGEITKPLM